MDYRPERAGLARYLRQERLLGAALRAQAEKGAAAARAAAPVDSGAYRNSIHVENAGITDRGRSTARQTVDIVADINYAADVEFRRGSNRPLGAAVDAVENT